MRLAPLLALATLAAPRLGAQPDPASSRTALATGTIAITGVTVVPMTSDTALANHTVVIRDGRIATMGPAGRVAVPSGARRIDGRGRWLVPGFADMHVHLHADDAIPDSVAPYELGVMLANGVTAARLMIGTPEHLALRRELASGRVAGPNLWIASPQFAGKQETNGRLVATPEQARVAVREVTAAGYDFVKLTTDITRPVYDAIVDEARARGIRVVGHVDPQVGTMRAIEAGQQIEHLDNTFESVRADSAPADIPPLSNYGIYRAPAWRALDHMDDRKVDALAGAIARAGVWSVPTLAVFNTAFATGQTPDEVKARPDWALSPPAWRDLYMRTLVRYWSDSSRLVRTDARRARFVQVRNRLVKAIVDSGGKVMTGSDTPEWFMTYGFTLHRELAALVEAGLTPYQALLAATRHPAEYLGAQSEWGTVARGRRADLVLLAGDPRADIANTTRIVGVAVGGRWLDDATRERMIRDAAARLTGASTADARD